MRQAGLLHIIGNEVLNRVCTNCELSYCAKLKTNCMGGVGSPGAIMFCGKSPGKEDDGIGTPMTGNNGKLFYGLLLDAGFTREEVYVTNCIRCSPLESSAGVRVWKACQPHFLEELNRVRPKMIVAVGAEATEYLTGHKGVSSLRATGLTLACDESYTVYPIRQPMALEHCQTDADKQALRESMVEDLKRIRDIYYGGGKVNVDTVQETTDYQIAYSHADVLAFLEELRATPGPLSCDLETVNVELTEGVFHPDDGLIQAIGFSNRPGHARAIPLHAKGIESIFWWPDGYVDNTLIPLLRAFLLERRDDVYGHNFCKFDSRWTRSKLDVDFPGLKFDTLLGAYVTFHGLRSYELEVLANSMCGMTKWKKEFTVQDTVAQCNYLCKDVDATARLRTKIEEAMDDNERTLLECLMMPAAYELMLMEELGAMVDPKALDALQTMLDSKIDPARIRIAERAEVREWKFEHGTAFNPGSPDHVRDILFTQMGVKGIKKTGSKQWSTDASVLEALREDVPLCDDILELRKLEKLAGTYAKGVRERMREQEDGFHHVIHTTYPMHKTATGRLSCIAKGTPIEVLRDVAQQPDGVPIEDVKAGDLAYCFDKDKNLVLRRVVSSWKTGTKEVVRLNWQGSGHQHTGYLDLTPEHPVRMLDGSYRRADQLQPGDRLAAMSRGLTNGYARLWPSWHEEISREHRFIYEQLHGELPEHVHHDNENKLDNRPNNLLGMTAVEHTRWHGTHKSPEQREKLRQALLRRIAAGEMRPPSGADSGNWLGLTREQIEEALVANDWSVTKASRDLGHDFDTFKKYVISHGFDPKELRKRNRAGRRDAIVAGAAHARSERQKLIHNHEVVSVQRLGRVVDVYDLEIEDAHCYIASEICVHNSEDPNLQNQPRPDTMVKAGFTKEDASMMKDIFVAREEFTYLERDQSQVELRVIASISGCKRMIDMFLNNQDVHAETAAAVYNVDMNALMVSDEATYEAYRNNSKRVNFGIIYGMTEQGLIQRFVEAGSTEQDAKNFLVMHQQLFPEIWQYMKDQEQLVLQYGQQTTYFGRTRVYEDKSPASMRAAYNNPVQSQANDVTVIGLIRCGRELRRRGMRSRPLLTVHDSIIFETYIDEFWEVVDLSTELMSNLSFPWLKVPLVVDAKAGPRWGSMMKVDLKNRCLKIKK